MNKNFVFCKEIKNIYRNNNCTQFEIAALEEIVTFQFIPILFGLSCALFIRNNKEIFSNILFKICYSTFLGVAKVSNAYRRVKNYFVTSSPSVTDISKKTYVYDEVKVIKNGVRCALFETMATFKESSYLGNPNEYYDVEEIVEESESATSCSFDSDLIDDHTSHSSLDSSSPASQHSHSSHLEEPEELFIMENNDSTNTVEFSKFDFIMYTNYRYPESFETSKQNYTKIYRTFTQNDFNSDKTKFEISNAEMILCTLQIDGDETEYEIDLSQPYNFNVVGNMILDEKFVRWYIRKNYNYAIEPFTNYKITCLITKGIKIIQLDQLCGLRVLLDEYEPVTVNTSFIQ